MPNRTHTFFVLRFSGKKICANRENTCQCDEDVKTERYFFEIDKYEL